MLSLIKNTSSGKEFNETYKDTLFYNFLSYGFTNQLEGACIYFKYTRFKPTTYDLKNGVYFYGGSKHDYIPYNCKHIAIIEIPDDARVHIEQNKFKSNKITITEIINFNDIGYDFWINMLPHDASALEHINEEVLTEELIMSVIQKDGTSIKYVPGQFKTEYICALAVKQNGLALRHVGEVITTYEGLRQMENTEILYVTDEICTLAVEQNPFAIEYVPHEYLTKELCISAVKRIGLALKYIHSYYLDTNICIIAIKQNGNAIKYVPNRYLTKELCILALEQNCSAIKYMDNCYLDEELCTIAVKQDGNAIKYHFIKKFLTDKIYKLAVQNNGLALKHIKNQTEEICILAITQNRDAIQYVNLKTESSLLNILINVNLKEINHSTTS